MLGAPSGVHSTQRLTNGWLNNVIVKLTIGLMKGPLVCLTMDQRAFIKIAPCRFENWLAIESVVLPDFQGLFEKKIQFLVLHWNSMN